MYDVFSANHGEFFLRLIVSCFCGIAIGFERKNRAKEAGIRTHCIVACASALMMIVSKYGFFDLATNDGIKVADGARIAAQVVSGIGFLGAGIIFTQKHSVRGLTTAAGIWATSGIGLALGAGMYFIGIIATIIILVMQYVLHSNISIFRMPKSKVFAVYNVTEKGFQSSATALLNQKRISVSEVSVKKHTDKNVTDYIFTIEIHSKVTEEEIADMFPYECMIKSIE